MNDPAVMPAADFLAGLVERASGRARTLMPRLPLPFEPIASRHSEETMFDALDPPPAPAREEPAIPLSPSRSNTAPTHGVRVEITRERPSIVLTPASHTSAPSLVESTGSLPVTPASTPAHTRATAEPLMPAPRRSDSPVTHAPAAARKPRAGSDEETSDSPVTPRAGQSIPSPQTTTVTKILRSEEQPSTLLWLRSLRADDPAPLEAAARPNGEATSPPAGERGTMVPKPAVIQSMPSLQVRPRDAARVLPAPPVTPEPAINVSIGVVEVRALEKTPGAGLRPTRSRRAPMSLEEYLSQRRGRT